VIRRCANEMDIMTKFINAITEYLLTLFVDEINVVQDNNLLLFVNGAGCLAKGLDIITIIIDALLFQTINVKYILLNGCLVIALVIFKYNCIHERSFTRTHVANDEYIQIINFNQCIQNLYDILVYFKIRKINGLVFVNKEFVFVFHDFD
jgi:hypothetical protein